jgi:hypothetical protein
MEAYPWISAETMSQIVERLRKSGSNVVWIGHNNPGEVEANAAEPGLSYAVYEALKNPADPRRETACAILLAVERLLVAVRAQGLKAVLPIGYQSQMGSAWDAANPGALRTEARGGIDRTTTVVNASFFAPEYQRDIRAYYQWVNARLVQPYRDAILMINLADEPSGGDYSAWADAEFTARNGFSFAEAVDQPARVVALGAFQTGYVAEYAAWSAQQWAELDPGMPTTMSFCGAIGRLHLQLPEVEAVFARTPPTFYPTFDAYPRDGPPDMALDEPELIRLFTLVRTVGHFSAKYNRPFWLWSTANSWGLAQASSRPANVADAVANGYYLAMLARQTGGWLQGIAVWNYNVVGQGLYNETRRTAYNPDTMFARVSESLPRIREILASRPGSTRVLLLAPPAFAYRILGASRSVDPFALRTYELHRLAALARNNVAAAVVNRLADENLTDVATIVLLARFVDDLPEEDASRLREFAERGGNVVALREFEPVLGRSPVYISGDRPEEAFADSTNPDRLALWRRVLAIDRPLSGGFALATAGDALLYNIGGALQVEVALPFPGRGWLVDPSGANVRPLLADGGRLAIALDNHHYVYLAR